METSGDYARRRPGRYAAMRVRLPTTPLTADESVSIALAAGRRHAALLRAALRDYDLSGDTAVHAIRLLGSVVRGFASLDLAGGFDYSGTPPRGVARLRRRCTRRHAAGTQAGVTTCTRACSPIFR
jgi:hypothetical protein